MRTVIAESRWASLRASLTLPMLRRSLIVTGLVGAVLTAINQGDRVLLGEDVSILKIALTFVVPFCVSTYGSYAARRLSGRR